MNDSNNTKDLRNITLSGVFWKGLERIAAQAVSTVVSIVLARILVPEDYSVVGIVAIFFAFCNLFISCGLNSALIQKKDADILDYSTILITNVTLAAALYAVMFFTAPLIAMVYKKELLTPVIRVMSLSFFINGYKAVVSAKVMSDLQFKKFFWSTLGGTIISAVVGIWLAKRGYGPWALVAQQMTNSFIDSLILSVTSKARFVLHFSMARFKTLFRFGGKIFLASIITVVYDQVKPLLVGIQYSTADLAYYNKGKSFPDLISSIGTNTLSSSLFPVMAKVQDDKTAVLQMTRRFMQVSSFIVFPMMIGFLAVADGFVRIVLTEKWLPIVPYIMIFCVSEMFKPIQTGNLQAIRAIGRSDIILILEIIKKSSYFVVILLFVLFTNSPVLLAVSSIFTTLLASVINMFPNRKLIGYTYIQQVSDLVINLLTATAMGVAVYCMRFLSLNAYLLLPLQIVAGIILYAGMNYVLKNKSMKYILELMKGFLHYGQNKGTT